MDSTVRHAFLTPGHNCWSLWTSSGSQNIKNDEGTSHRALETLAFAIDKMACDGWHVQQIYVDQGTPTLVLLSKEEPLAQ